MSLFDFLLWTIMGVISFRMIFLKREFDVMIGWLMFGLIILSLQLLYEGYKWQSVLLYLMPLMWLLFYKYNLKRVVKITLISFFVLSSALLVVFPTPVLDEPTGQYVVGTTRLSVMDDSRFFYDEIRELPIQIWYPADSTEDKSPARWMIDGKETTRAFASSFHMLPFMMDQLNHVKTHSYEDVVMTEGEFPIVVLSHGWSSFRNLHLNFAEHLASNGYIVIALDHTYGAAITRLQDGRVITMDKSLLDNDDILKYADELIETYRDDIERVIDEIPKLNQNHPILKNHLEMDKLALLGHSTGAGACVLYALENDVDAIIGLDAWVEPIEIDKTLTVPNLFFRSEAWSESNNNQNLSKVTETIYEVNNANHQDFTLVHKFSPILELIGYTSDDSQTMQEEYILEFFDHYLKGRRLNLKKLDEQYKDETSHKVVNPEASN
ncbi:MAG: hypothetical protein JEZ08_12580 [Clostridiales bacterium]|nr:hypothetical protein [Clostridiales bacterium]